MGMLWRLLFVLRFLCVPALLLSKSPISQHKGAITWRPLSQHKASLPLVREIDGPPLVQRLYSQYGGVFYLGHLQVGGKLQRVIYDTGSWHLVVGSRCEADAANGVFSQLRAARHTHGWTEPPRYTESGKETVSEECKQWRDNVVDVVNNTVFLGNKYAKCCPAKICPLGAYDPSHSSTYSSLPGNESKFLKPQVYVSGTAIVRSGMDTVTITHMSNANVVIERPDVPVDVIVNHTMKNLLLNSPQQPTAIVGIGPGNRSNFQERVLNHLGIHRYTFCFPEDPQMDGFLTWNDEDRSSDPTWQTVPVLGLLHWFVKLDAFVTSGPDASHASVELGCKSGCGVIFDTGSTMMNVPSEIRDALVDEITSRGIQDCSDLSQFPDLRIMLGDKEFMLPPQSYLADTGPQLLGASNDTRDLVAFPMTRSDADLVSRARRQGIGAKVNSCTILMASVPCPMVSQYGPVVIMGMPWFRNYGVQFDTSKEPERFLRFAPRCGAAQGSATSYFHERRQQKQLYKASPTEWRVSPWISKFQSGPQDL